METWEDFDKFSAERVVSWFSRLPENLHPKLREVARRSIEIGFVQEVGRRLGIEVNLHIPTVMDNSGWSWTYDINENRFYVARPWEIGRPLREGLMPVNPDIFVQRDPDQPFMLE